MQRNARMAVGGMRAILHGLFDALARAPARTSVPGDPVA